MLSNLRVVCYFSSKHIFNPFLSYCSCHKLRRMERAIADYTGRGMFRCWRHTNDSRICGDGIGGALLLSLY